MFLMTCAAILGCVGPAYIVHAHVVCDVCIIVYIWTVCICVCVCVCQCYSCRAA